MPKVELALSNVAIFSLSSSSTTKVMYDFDVNHFRDPMGNKGLMKECADGKDPKVIEWIKVDPRTQPILTECIALAKDIIDHQGKKWLTIGFRDYHGRWISRAVATLVADALSEVGYKVGVLYGEAPGR